jgi:hypothetical protein
MSKKYNPHFDLEIFTNKVKSKFDFSNDLKLGHLGEEYINELFNNPKITIECKFDRWTIVTNNLCIEIESRGKPSGLSTSKADIWFFVIDGGAIIAIPTELLRNICNKLVNIKKYVKMVGDKKDGKPTSKAILIPLSELNKLIQESLKKEVLS